jgi:RNA recognition motif-containing protein
MVSALSNKQEKIYYAETLASSPCASACSAGSNILPFEDLVETCNPTKLFVGSISSTTTKEDLVRLFSPFGPILEIVVLVEKDGRPKFSAFVNMKFQADAEKAIFSLDRKVTLPGAKKILEVRMASSSSSKNVADDSSCSSSPKEASPRSNRQSFFKVFVPDHSSLDTPPGITRLPGNIFVASTAFEAVLFWLETLSVGAQLLSIPTITHNV